MSQDASTPERSSKHSHEPISKTFIKFLLAIVVIALLVTLVVSWTIETGMAHENARNILRINIEDVQQDIIDASDSNLLALTKEISRDIDLASEPSTELLNELMKHYNVSEISIIDENGIITMSTEPNYVGFDMASGDQSAEFMVLLDGERQY